MRATFIESIEAQNSFMDKVVLAGTGLKVSRICFGTIPFGGRGWRGDPYVEPEAAGKILRKAFESGINFWDTAEAYGTHPHVREGLKLVDRESVVVSTKTQQTGYEEARSSLEKALRELETEYIDIYYMHYVRSPQDLESRRGAFEALLEARREGLIKHIGVSTHWSTVVERVAEIPEIEVLMVKINKIGRMDCPLEDMLKAVEKAYTKGKALIAMKLLAYGSLTVREGLAYGLTLPHVHSVCIGMRTVEELEENLKLYREITKKSL